MTRFDVEPIQIADGFQFMEGPAFDRHGNLYAVAGPQGLVVRFLPEIAAEGAWHQEIFCATGGWPNGSAFHRDGRLFCTDYSEARRIIEIPPEGGSLSVFADRCSEDGKLFEGPNDLRFHRSGNLYWTDPGSEGNLSCVYWATPDGTVRRFADGLDFPNGLTFSSDWSTLIVAESNSQSLWAYPVCEDGSAGERRLFVKIEGVGEDGKPGLPDGMAFDVDGNLYVACWNLGMVCVFAPDGELVARLRTPGAKTTNVAFWGESLFVTEASIAGIFRFDLGVAGQPLFAQSR